MRVVHVYLHDVDVCGPSLALPVVFFRLISSAKDISLNFASRVSALQDKKKHGWLEYRQ